MNNFTHVHFIGIGGIGMSALARLFVGEGKRVSGSDRSPSEITETLQKEGVVLFPEQRKENITSDIDLVVYTEAMPHDHEELVAARAQGIRTMNYFEALGMVANEYYLIAVAGSHGKTTTTAMLIDIFERAGFDPSGVVGSLRATTKSNYRKGKSKYFIVEACEYKRDFMSLEPDILVITNIEHEYVDYYRNLEDVQRAFKELAIKVPSNGYVVANAKDPNTVPVLEGLKTNVVDYTSFLDPLRTLKVPGMHNHLNAAAAMAVALQCGIASDVAEHALKEFAGTWRRFEYKGDVCGAKVYDDYGHHPTEIIATLSGAKELYPGKRTVLIFQSHTYTRTNVLFNDFVHALSIPDMTYILPIYAAREINESGISHTSLAEAVNARGGHACAVETFDEAVLHAKREASPETIIIVMGAGDITRVATTLTTSSK